MATSNPERARWMAIALPMPRLAPVTRATPRSAVEPPLGTVAMSFSRLVEVVRSTIRQRREGHEPGRRGRAGPGRGPYGRRQPNRDAPVSGAGRRLRPGFGIAAVVLNRRPSAFPG